MELVDIAIAEVGAPRGCLLRDIWDLAGTEPEVRSQGWMSVVPLLRLVSRKKKRARYDQREWLPVHAKDCGTAGDEMTRGPRLGHWTARAPEP